MELGTGTRKQVIQHKCKVKGVSKIIVKENFRITTVQKAKRATSPQWKSEIQKGGLKRNEQKLKKYKLPDVCTRTYKGLIANYLND